MKEGERPVGGSPRTCTAGARSVSWTQGASLYVPLESGGHSVGL